MHQSVLYRVFFAVLLCSVSLYVTAESWLIIPVKPGITIPKKELKINQEVISVSKASRVNGSSQIMNQLALMTLTYTKDCKRLTKVKFAQHRIRLNDMLSHSERQMIKDAQQDDTIKASYLQRCIKQALSRDPQVVHLRQYKRDHEFEQAKYTTPAWKF